MRRESVANKFHLLCSICISESDVQGGSSAREQAYVDSKFEVAFEVWSLSCHGTSNLMSTKATVRELMGHPVESFRIWVAGPSPKDHLYILLGCEVKIMIFKNSPLNSSLLQSCFLWSSSLCLIISILRANFLAHMSHLRGLTSLLLEIFLLRFEYLLSGSPNLVSSCNRNEPKSKYLAAIEIICLLTYLQSERCLG